MNTKISNFRLALSALPILMAAVPVSTLADAFDTWTLRHSSSSGQLNGVTFDNGKLIAVGDIPTSFASNFALTSSDGVAWKLAGFTGPEVLPDFGVTSGNGQFLDVGTSGDIYTSPDGSHWTDQSPGTTQDLRGGAYGNGKFVVVGLAGTILTSPDGITWTDRSIPGNLVPDFYGLTYANGAFVAVGGFPVVDGPVLAIFTSQDGVTWKDHSPGGDLGVFNGVAYQSGTFVAVGISKGPGAIYSSSDGVTWTSRTSGTANALTAVAGAFGWFVTVGYGGTVLTSQSGLSWSGRSSGTAQDLFGVAFDTSNFDFVAVGHNQTVLQSGILAAPISTVPRLSVTRSGSAVTISWPSSSAGFVLQQATDFDIASWSTFSGTINSNASTLSITVAIDTAKNFYRLKSGL